MLPEEIGRGQAMEVLMEEVKLEDGSVATYIVIPMRGDGSCCFRALSFCIHGDAELHIQIRQQIVQFVVERWQEYGIRTLTANGESYANANMYEQAMSSHGTYGSACEVQAAAELYPQYTFES